MAKSLAAIATVLAMLLGGFVCPTTAYATSLSGGTFPARSYGLDFSCLTDGYVWECREYLEDGNDNEAVVYAVDAGVGNSMAIPDTVAFDGTTYNVVGVVSVADAKGSLTYEDEYGDTQYWREEFGGRSYIQSISVPESVRFIGRGAFNEYKKLEDVTFRGTSQLERIEEYAFADCKSLRQFDGQGAIVFPQSVQSVEQYVFSGCTSIEKFVFPLGAEVHKEVLCGYVGYGESYSLKSVENAPQLFALPDEAANSLESITYAPGLSVVEGCVDSIGYHQDMPNLRTVVLPEGLLEIGRVAFSGSSLLESCALPSTLTRIGDNAFNGCSSLTGINELPAGITYVGDRAFSGCKNLHMAVDHPGRLDLQYEYSGVTSITLHGTSDLTAWIGVSRGCDDLQSINVIPEDDNCPLYSIDGVLYAHDVSKSVSWLHGGECLMAYPAAKSGGTYTIPAHVQSVAPYAFTSCKFSEIHIPVTIERLLEFWADYNYDSPFAKMASVPTLYYVKNSYAASDVEGYRDLKDYGDFEVNIATDPGPQVTIVYDLAGGTNASTNPSSVEGGTSVTLANPTRSGYTFAGWYVYDKDYYEEYKLNNGILKPHGADLIDGSITVRAKWSVIKKTQTITASNKSVAMGKTLKLGAKTNGNGKLTYKSSNTAIVKVDSTGKLTPVKVGKATITIKAAETSTHKSATKKVTVTVVKGTNPLAAKAIKSSVTVSYSKVKSAKVTLASNIKITKKGAGSTTYSNASNNTTAKKFSVNKTTGKVTVPKGTKKGTYTIKVKVKAAGNTNYKAGSKVITYKIVVK